MSFWKENVEQIVSSNGFPLLTGAGAVSHEQMERTAASLYLEFDKNRNRQEALEADQADEAELKAIEAKLKRRSKS